MQRKRHINFKYWRKTIAESSTSADSYNSIQNKLHSIPKLLNMKQNASQNIKDDNINENNVESNVLYSIPCGCVLALLCMLAMFMLLNNSCYAIEMSTALTLSTPNMISDTAVPGSVATVGTSVSVSVANVDSYDLVLSFDKTVLTNGDTTINAGDLTVDNTWGYRWGDAIAYSAPTTSSAHLDVPALVDNAANFVQTLTFGVRFSPNAISGHYTNTGVLSLLATPKVVPTITWTLADGTTGPDSGITTMQEMTPAICNLVDTPVAVKAIEQTKVPTLLLKDSRDEQEYEIAKYPDGRCWMTSELSLQGDKELTKDNSNVLANWTLVAPLTSPDKHFDSNNYYVAESYRSGDVMLYSWTAATAGAGGNSSIISGSVNTSICPKGWSLPTGGNSGDFKALVDVALDNPTDMTHAKIFNSAPYNFVASGSGGALVDYVISRNGWWSRTANSATQAYALRATGRGGIESTYIIGRFAGYAVRCIAEAPEPETFTLTYYGDSTSARGYLAGTVPTAQTCTTNDSSCSIKISSDTVDPKHCGMDFLGWSTDIDATSADYAAGADIIIDSDTKLYAIWSVHTCGGAIS